MYFLKYLAYVLEFHTLNPADYMIHMHFTDEQCKVDGKSSHKYEIQILHLFELLCFN